MTHKKDINGHPHLAYHREKLAPNQVATRAEDFYRLMDERRTVREFETTPVPKEVLYSLLKTASTAPSGAHKQPWTFCLISDPKIKQQIREAAEEEEKISYGSRMSDTWKADLKPLGTDWEKPFLEDAPYLIVVFKQSYGMENGEKIQHYYVNESVGIACGFLIAAIHQAGLATVTHTPSPMNFLSKILNRPSHEKPFLLLPVGYAKEPTYVPDISRKQMSEFLVEF